MRDVWRGRARFLILCLAAGFILGFAGEVCAADLLGGKFRLQGFLRNETSMRLKDRVWNDSILGFENAKAEKNDLSVMRTTLLLDGNYAISSTLSFGFIFRSYYDAKWDLDNSIDHVTEDNEKDLRATPDGEYLEFDADLREYHLSWYIGPFSIKAGRQQIVWGESDAIRISDIINPLDYSKDYTTTAYGLSWEDVRIPQRMVGITYVVPESRRQYEVEIVLNPEDSRVNTYAPYGELYYTQGDSSLIGTFDLLTNPPFGLPPLGFTQKSFNDALVDAIDDANPANKSASFSGGMRVRGVFDGWDTHLFYYYQRVQNPVLTSFGNFSMAGFGIPFPWDVFDENLGVKAHFPHINTFGGTFNYFHDYTGAVFRGELGFTPDHPYSGLRQGTSTVMFDPDGPGPAPPAPTPLPWNGWFNDSVVYKDTLTYMVGFDRPTWITFLNEYKTFFITAQFIHKMIFNYDDTVAGENNKLLLSTVMGKDGFSDHQTMFTFKIDTEYYDATIKPDLLVVWDINGHNGYVKPSLAWEPNYDWRLEIGGLYFWADDYTSGAFGMVKDDDQIYCSIRWKF